jgi:hypothetical protein
MLKQVLRRTILNLRNWLMEDGARRKGPEDYQCSYLWLNSLFGALIKEGKGQLRPSYTWGALQAVYLARTIGVDRVSLIEFGVAGGNGLIALERAAEMLEREFEVGVDVYGFDSGCGLPQPTDYRDLPNLFSEGSFPMNEKELRARLKRANLILGLVKETIPAFIASKPAPVAFISFDLDLYSSTTQTFRLLEADTSLLMPRIHCHFDDILGFTHADHNGERLAITEFNASNPNRKISPIYGLRHYLPRPYLNDIWAEQAYMAHILDHPLYNKRDYLVQSRLDLSH